MNPAFETVREIVYYFPHDQRLGYVLNEDNEGTIAYHEHTDIISFLEKRKDLPPVEITITLPKSQYLCREERVFIRRRKET